MLEKLLSAEQVANHLDMHPKTLYKKLRENSIALNFVKLPGRNIGFRPQDVERYLELHVVTRDGSGRGAKGDKGVKATSKQSKRRAIHFMTDEEARAFFAGVERDEGGTLLCSPSKL